ncbi:piggyBac transposable element-derived protein 4-like [Vespula squamosa]|uniref:PiggyBac transposable element-derived protein 4-like n=1 Tax=Vespula squamosa TaxID=30214 RepID=A0ABD2AF66_VESSQ
MLKKCYGEFFHEHITGDKIIILYKSNNCTLTIHKSKSINKITIIINTKHKSVQINTTESEYLKQLYIITKPNSASMSSVKWQESTASNQNHIDGLCNINAWIPYKETSVQNISRQQFLLQIAKQFSSRRKGKRTRNIKIEDNGFEINFITNQCTITNDKEIIVIADSVENLLELQTNHESSHGTWHKNAYSHSTEN